MVEGGAGSVEAAQSALDDALDSGEVAIATQGALELALWSQDPELAEEILARVPWRDGSERRNRGLGALVALHHGLGRDLETVQALARRRGANQAAACAVLHRVVPGKGWDVEGQRALEALGEGLLGTQREALSERVQRLMT
jgi:hypothetical protein